MLRAAGRKSAFSPIDGTSVLGSFLQSTFGVGYHERGLDHYENPRNVGSLDRKDPDVGTPACGDVMKLQIKVKDGKIEKAVFKTFGRGSGIASSSLATEWLTGKTLDDAANIKNTHIAKHLALPPVKLHCSMLAEDAIKSSIKDYQKKAHLQN